MHTTYNNASRQILKLTAFCIFIFATTYLTAQTDAKIGTNPGNKTASAVLEVESTTKGFLMPRMSATQMNAISAPANGLAIYNTDQSCVFIYRNTTWISLCDSATNGLTKSGSIISLGGPLISPTVITATATNTLALSGLQGGIGSVLDSILTMDPTTGVLRRRSVADVIASGGNAWLLGGNAVTANQTIGTTTAFDFGIKTNNVTRLTFSSAGDITQAGTGQVTFTGNVDATNGLDVTNALLTANAGSTLTGATNINATGAGATNIGNSGSVTSVIGVTNINTSGASTTAIGNAGAAVNVTGTTTVTGATTVAGVTNINATGVAATTIGNAASTVAVVGTTSVTGATSINTTGALGTSIGNATSTTTVLGTTDINATGTGTTNIGTTGAATNNIGSATGTTNIAGNTLNLTNVPVTAALTDNVLMANATTGRVEQITVSNLVGGALTADNGLTKNTATNFRLGGTLVQNTAIAQAGFDMNFSGGKVAIGSATAPTSTLQVTGSQAVSFLKVTTATTLDATHFVVLANATAGAVTLTLPSAAGASGRTYYIGKSDESANAVTFSPALYLTETTTIATINFAKKYKIVSDGTNWWIYNE